MSGPVIVAVEQLEHSSLPWVVGRALIVNFLEEIRAHFFWHLKQSFFKEGSVYYSARSEPYLV